MYIEYVIADNFLLTYLAGAAAMRLCRNKPQVWRLLAAATVGTAVAVFYPFIRGGRGVALSVKAGLWLVLCVIMFAKTPRAGMQSIAFLGCTFAFGGASYAVLLCFLDEADMYKCPICTVLVCGVAVYAAVRRLIRRMRLPRVREPYEFGVRIKVLGAELNFAAFLDTGNCVFDERTGLPVVITDVERFTDKLDGAAAVRFAKQLPRLRKTLAHTPAGTAEIYMLEPTEITVYSDRQGHKINAMIGLVGGGNRFSDSHELLLGPAVMTEGI